MLDKKDRLVLEFKEITLKDVPMVGGKNASLGELFGQLTDRGVRTIGGFATTATAFQMFLDQGGLREKLRELFSGLKDGSDNLSEIGAAARETVLGAMLPESICDEVLEAYTALCVHFGRKCSLAVRSSATAEDLPGASFAGQHESFLNVCGYSELLQAIVRCYASLYTDRAIDYRRRNGFGQMAVSLSVGVQPMVDSSSGCSGVMFTLDPESGFRDAVVINGSYGLGEYLVQGEIVPDEWTIFKTTLGKVRNPIIDRKLGSKQRRLVFAERGTVGEDVPAAERGQYCLSNEDACMLAKWGCLIEDHYSQVYGAPTPMDIEWVMDGASREISVIQARPETVHSRENVLTEEIYTVNPHGARPIVSGQAVGEKVSGGPARVVRSMDDAGSVQEGDVLFARSTDPDWEPVMKKVAAIVTDEGGRTAHAAIVAREIGVPCIVGTGTGTDSVQNGQYVTVSCAEGLEGHVYDGQIEWSKRAASEVSPAIKTPIMLNVGDPGLAFSFAKLPAAGVGLARIEFIITNQIGIHPMALARFPNLKDPSQSEQIRERLSGSDPEEFFITRLASGVARIASAFYPKPVIVRTSDFKTNEYARLLGGAEFEPKEENPMLGFRGASRYYDERYEPGFALECRALRRVREDMGLTNVKVMIPFCRTVEEGKKVLATMAKHGLKQGDNGLEVYAMCEVPSNVLLAKEFLSIFDGFSIGSNDLTQLVLGLDRDSGTVAHLFDENSAAVRQMIARVIHDANEMHRPIGICGQAPSDFPEFAAWLVDKGITSISLNPDSIMKTVARLAAAEREPAHAQ